MLGGDRLDRLLESADSFQATRRRRRSGRSQHDRATSPPARPPVAGPRDTEREESFAEVGATAHFEIWRRLGIRPRDLPRPSVYLDLDEPLR